MGKDLAEHHEFARDKARGLPGRVRAESTKRQRSDLISDRAMHIRKEIEGHHVGADG